MATRENISGMGLYTTYGPAAPTTGGATPTGVAVDTSGFDAVAFLIAIDIAGSTLDTNDNATWTGVSQGEIQASYGTAVTVGTGGVVRTVSSAKAAADVQPMKLGYIGSSRYVRAYPVLTGTQATGTPIYIAVVLGNAHIKPTA